jgi:hypothetical protein
MDRPPGRYGGAAALGDHLWTSGTVSSVVFGTMASGLEQKPGIHSRVGVSCWIESVFYARHIIRTERREGPVTIAAQWLEPGSEHLLDPERDAELLRQFKADELPDAELPPDPFADAPASDWLRPCECCQCREEPAAAPPVLASPEQGWAVPGVTPDVPAGPAAIVVGEVVAAMQSLTAQLAEVQPKELSPALALGEAEALLGVQQALRVQMTRRLADVHARELYEVANRNSTKTWLRQVAPDTALSDITLGRTLAALPTLDAAVQGGRVSLGAAQEVRKALAKLERYVDRKDGLIDGQPAEPTLAAVIAQVLDIVAKQHLGLADDDPLLLALDQRLGEIVLGALHGVSQAVRLEQAFVALAEKVPPTRVKPGLELLLGALLPNELERQLEAAEQARSLSLTPKPGGGWSLRAELSPEAGEQLHAALSAEVIRDSANPLDTKAWQELRAQAEAEGRDVLELLREHHDTPTPLPDPWAAGDTSASDTADPDPAGCADPAGDSADPADADGLRPTEAWGIPLPDEPTRTRSDGSLQRPRTRGKRLHDAFGNLLSRYLGSGLGGEHDKVPVQLAITLSSDLVDGKPGASPATSTTGRPLPRSLLRRLWCDAHVTVLLMSKGFRPLGVVHTGRTLTAQERKASLVASDYRCSGVDCCDGLPHPCKPLLPHHLITFASGGTTSIEENVWLCDSLHDDIHVGKRTVPLRDGRWINENGVVSHPHDQLSIWDQG